MFIPALTERGLFGEQGGPDAYQADEKLSKKLTLVRIGRFIQDGFDLEEGKYYGTQ